MNTEECRSDFLPSWRKSISDVAALAESLAVWKPLETSFRMHPDGMALLTEQRQIVWANEALARMAEAPGLDCWGTQPDAGLRYGEALGCMNADNSPGGCGTSVACRRCQMANAVLDALRWGEGGGEAEFFVHRAGEIVPLTMTAEVSTVVACGERLLFCRFRNGDGPTPQPEGTPPSELAELFAAIFL